MPIIGGNMYPELRPVLQHFNKLNVLILGDPSSDRVQSLINQVNVLHVYLVNIGKPHIKINLLTDTISDETALLDKVKEFDVDVVFDQNMIFSDKFINKNFYTVDTVQSIDVLYFSIENFLVGSGVAWRLQEPVWNTQLSLKYMEQPGLCREYYICLTEYQQNSKYTSDQTDRIRYIVNKIKQIDYARDLLHYYVKRLRKAERAGMGDDDTYNLELNYHISSYYFLLAGALDSAARLLNDFYKLGLTSYGNLALEKDVFIKHNKTKHTGLARFLKTKKINHWMISLKKRRNFIAHEGDMRQTPLVKEKKRPLTNDELNAIVDQQMDWSALKLLVSQEIYDAQRAMVFEMTRMKSNYEVIARNIMHIHDSSGHALWHPLLSVDFDYEHFSKVMDKILVKLKSDA